ncbi:alanine--tRNA ligase, mitochondrial isoform X1 [Schistocerca americana]|uniref:alanine--tRNA ligase, mitochondrial isoform X1 n=1 Tax=Schistocerca americana TaxID=7009 RepID=UPI001F4F52D4|nr:alanine--tRNA ligase, mitochondrial isoform X1 [Schistocerca americana]
MISHSRCYSSLPSCKTAREMFINYFVRGHDHKHIRSSPVVPFCDPTVPFVNAGMNQFKGIFLGQIAPPCLRAANSQKCIRVGGKHNDLHAVGADGHHHTFFEMLGNWSFGDYFKETACELAWKLLTGPYGISRDQLYVTYFGGSEELGLSADTESYEIWRKLGIPANRILPFGTTDNFWEMGSVGPCGPCTEIHIDHVNGRKDVQNRVNKGFSDVTELWNLVFIQYNRKSDGTLEKLPTHHVDTGMGFERLVAVLQNKSSNYDTDIFLPLFSAIQKITGAPAYRGLFGVDDISGIDTAYRIIADHCRMATVAIADGVFPHHNLKLRRVIRKAIHVGERYFHARKSLLSELSNYVAETLADAYPEIPSNLKQVQLIIGHEEQLLVDLENNAAVEWKKIVNAKPHLSSLDITEMPGLVLGYQELQTAAENLMKDLEGEAGIRKKPVLPGSVVFKLYDTYGLDEKHIRELADAEGISVDMEGFHVQLDNAKLRTKKGFTVATENELNYDTILQLRENGIYATEDQYKYMYSKENGVYMFPYLKCSVQAIVVDGKCVERTQPGIESKIILNKSNFYHEAGGQESDSGYMELQNGLKVAVNSVTNCQGYILHKIVMDTNSDMSVSVGDEITLCIDCDKRLANMRNHTATHLINAALRRILTVTCQNSSRVTSKDLFFDFSVYGEQFGTQQVKILEKALRELISSKLPVKRRSVSENELLMLGNVTCVPGEVYPEQGIYLIEVESEDGIVSREPCCGTHVLNTADLEAISVVSLQSSGSGSRCLRAVTGPTALSILENGLELEKEVRSLDGLSGESLSSSLQVIIHKLRNEANRCMPYTTHVKCSEILETLKTRMKQQSRQLLTEQMRTEMQDVLRKLNSSPGRTAVPFIVHFLQCSSFQEDIPLQKATKLCSSIPVLLLARSEGMIKARCCVPEGVASEKFNAQLWMQPVMATLKGQGFVPRGQNPSNVYNMKGKNIPLNKQDAAINIAMQVATEFAENALSSVSYRKRM